MPPALSGCGWTDFDNSALTTRAGTKVQIYSMHLLEAEYLAWVNMTAIVRLLGIRLSSKLTPMAALKLPSSSGSLTHKVDQVAIHNDVA